MRVFLDFDGVLGDMARVFTSWAWKRYGVQRDDFPQWGIAEALGIPHHTERDVWEYAWREHKYLYPGAEEFLTKFTPAPEIVSTRPSGPPRDNFNAQFRLRMRGARAIHLFENWQQKERFILRESPHALLEDNLEFLVKLPESETKLFLMDRPWNQSLDSSGHYTRVRTYEEFLEKI